MRQRTMSTTPNIVGLGLKTGMPKKVEMPEDIKQEVFAVMETAEKIKGEDYTDFVKFVMNLNGLLSMFVENFRPEDHIQNHPNSEKIINQLQDMISSVASTLSSMYATAKGISDDDVREALKTADTMNSIVAEFVRRMKDNED